MSVNLSIDISRILAFYAREGGTPAVESDRFRHIVWNQGANITAAPRIVEPDNGDPALMDYNFHVFAHEGPFSTTEIQNGDTVELGSGHHFETHTESIFPPAYLPPLMFPGAPLASTLDGLRFRRGAFAGGVTAPFTIGLRHYMEEGIFTIYEPFGGEIGFGHHNTSAPTRGKLTIIGGGGTPYHFKWRMANSAGVEVDTTFPEIPIPVQPASPTVPPVWVYYHFRRDYSTSEDRMEMTVSVNTGSLVSSLVKTLPGLYAPGVDIDQEHIWGTQLAIYGGVNRAIDLLWLRCGWSDTQESGSGNAPWTNPRIYEQSIYQPHGEYPLGWIHSGSNGTYWGKLRINGLYRPYGSKLEARAVASDDPPRSSFDGLWDGREWQDVVGGQSIDLDDPVLGRPQGRFLLVQLRFIPSPTTSLSGSTCHLTHSVLGTAEMVATTTIETGGALLPIEVGGEGQATQTLPLTPQYAFEVTHGRRVVRNRFDGPYEQRYATTTKTRRSWRVHYNAISTANKNALLAFFRGLRAAEAFLWTPEDETDPVAAALVGSEIDAEKLAPNVWRLSELVFAEVL